MSGGFVMAGGLTLLAVAGALFFAEKKWPGKIAAAIATLFNRKD